MNRNLKTEKSILECLLKDVVEYDTRVFLTRLIFEYEHLIEEEEKKEKAVLKDLFVNVLNM